MKNNQEMENRTLREKSVLYPYYGLKESIEFAKIVQRIAGKGCAPNSLVASEVGVSTSTKSFSYSISSARQFGLIMKTKEGLQTTDRAKKIFAPLPGQDTNQLIKDSFKTPPLYQKIIKQFEGVELPAQEGIANVMYHKGVADAAKNRAAKIFLQSANYAAVVDDDNRLMLEHRDESELDEIKESNSFKSERPVNESQWELPNRSHSEASQTVNLALVGDRNAKLIVPRNLNTKDVQKIKKLLDILVIDDTE